MYDDDEFMVSDAQDAAPVSPMVVAPEPEAPGIGMDAQAPAPVADGIGIAPLSRREVQLDRRKEAISQMGGLEKFMSAIGEFGAGVQGKASPLDKRLAQQQQEKLQKLQEFKIHTDALQDGVKMAQKMKGEARTQFIESYAAQLDSVRPGLGDTYRSLSKQPDMGTVLAKYSANSPTLKRALELDQTGEAALKLLSSADAMKTINGEIDSSVMPTLLKKGQTFKMGWQQLVPPEMLAEFNKDGQIVASEFLKANEWIKANKPDMKALVLSDEELQIVGRNADAFYGTLGIASPKTEQDILKERGKVDARDKAPTTRTITQGGTEIQQEYKDGKWTEVGRGPRFKAGDDGRGADRDRKTELQLSDDYRADTKGFKDAKVQFSSATDYMASIAKDAKKATSAGDRSLMFAYAKMNDPGDKVAVKDLQDIQKLGGVPERFVQAAIGLAKGNMLPPRIRQEMHDEITRKFKELNAQQHQTETEYRTRAERYKLDPRNIVQPYAVNMRGPNAGKPEVGAVIPRGGKNWKVTGYDKDGEPLVEEVK